MEENKLPILYNSKDKCCGCTACYSACPTGSIEMLSDDEGFLYPHINESTCINCHKCLNVCAFKSDNNTNEYKKPLVYAVKHKDISIRMKSRSGGIFTAVSDYVLDNGGVVYGCVLDSSLNAYHTRAKNKSARDKMRGSKYIQSEIGNTFKEAEKDLKEGRLVLFTGTSCQIAGLKSALQKDYDNLLCMDIVCHGVPSTAVFKEYIKWIENKEKAKCVNIDFRNKIDYGWIAHIETLTLNKNNKVKHKNSNVFKMLFYGHNILRPCCYVCPYKDIIHTADITIGDYWGIEKASPGFSDNKGVSLVLINSEKGKKIFDLAKNKVEFKECAIEDSMQPPLIKPFPKPNTREQFWQDFREKDFEYIAQKYAKYSKSRDIKLCIKKLVYKFLKK